MSWIFTQPSILIKLVPRFLWPRQGLLQMCNLSGMHWSLGPDVHWEHTNTNKLPPSRQRLLYGAFTFARPLQKKFANVQKGARRLILATAHVSAWTDASAKSKERSLSSLLCFDQAFLHQAAVELLDVRVNALPVGLTHPHQVVGVQQRGAARQPPADREPASLTNPNPHRWNHEITRFPCKFQARRKE